MRFEKILPENSKRRRIAKKIYNKLFFNYNTEEKKYLRWIKNNEPSIKEIATQKEKKFKLTPKISILVPLYNTPENFFDELVESLKNQTYTNWELCLADGSPEPIKFIEKYLDDTRIVYKVIGENKGISGNTNEALKLATGDYIALLDHDDLLPIFSLYEIVKRINEKPDVEFIYSDEDKIETLNKPRYGAFFKPDFSPYTLNSANYICHFSIFKKELINKIGGFDSKYDGSQDWDIVARATENTDKIEHISKILYHWRVHQNSTAGNSDSKPYAFEIGKKVIKDHIKRNLNVEVDVDDGLTPGSYNVKYKVNGNPKVSIIIDAVNLSIKKIEELIQKVKITTYNNYELVVITSENIDNVDKTIRPEENTFKNYNKAVDEIDGEYFIIFDEKLIKIQSETYIEDLLGIAQDSNVAVVGTKLFNRKKLVEHNGIILGMNGVGDLVYKGVPEYVGTYMQRLSIIHNVYCSYVKYSMITTKTFKELGKFNTNYQNILESIEFGIKTINAGKQIVLNPNVSICAEDLLNINKPEKEEQEKFIEKWKENYNKGDRFFSPNLSNKDTNISFKI